MKPKAEFVPVGQVRWILAQWLRGEVKKRGRLTLIREMHLCSFVCVFLPFIFRCSESIMDLKMRLGLRAGVCVCFGCCLLFQNVAGVEMSPNGHMLS